MEISNIILIVLLHSLAFGTACYFMGAQREIGPVGAALLGVILGTIGLIIVLLSRKKDVIPFSVQIQKYKALLDSGTITEREYNHLKGRLIEQQ